MPKPRSEEEKKHGDKLESLIGRTGGGSSREGRNDDAGDEDPAQRQDDDAEDAQNDDVSDRRDVGKPSKK
ncbi:MAG TPA: hypothetical protein VLI71_06440 [Gammaproteobacteria bacterium]|nr:hypothetical protein [Gammaproteobacteria bacterium]